MFKRYKLSLLLFIFISILSAPPVHAQEGAAFTETLTPSEAQAVKNLTPAQQRAVETELSKTGGKLTPEAIKRLKKSPEFKGLKPEEVKKGRELLKKKKVGREIKGEEAETRPEKKVEVKEKRGVKKRHEEGSLFGRYISSVSPLVVSTDIKPYGYDIFKGAPLIPPEGLPVASDYIIGPGDEIKILLWGRINASHTLTVTRDGTILFPNIGPLSVAGMTFEEMKRFLTRQAKNIVGAEINVTMGRLRSIQVFVLGEVKKPGAYTVSAMSTLTNALMAAGGPTGIGSLRRVELKRKNRTVATMDFYDLLMKGDKSRDRRLKNGDVVFVPTVGPLVGVAGNVKRPAIYELKGKTDLADILQIAGGIIPTAYTQQIQVERVEKNRRSIVVDINAGKKKKAKGFILQDADLVKVFSIVDRDVNAVYLMGNVKRPGKYQLKKGMRVKDLIKDESFLLKDTYLDYALIKRGMPPTLETVLIPFDLGAMLFRDSREDNVRLEPQDTIYIFSRWFFEEKPTISIAGEVRKGGTFTLDGNMRIKDLVLKAGGLTKDAYPEKAELIRTNKKMESRTIYFDLSRAMDEDKDENLLLRDRDSVIVHSIWEEKWRETVSIEGEVKKTGSYILTKGLSIRDLMFKAGGPTRDTYMGEAEVYRTDWKTKKVTLVKFNLKKALQGNEKDNVRLRDMDRVVIHSIWEKVAKQVVTISGEINKPGDYPYISGMTVKDLIFAAGSLLESAYLGEAELVSHTVKDGKISVVSYRKIDLKKALSGDPKENITLRPYDSLFIRKITDWREDRYAVIKGEVRLPGRYVLKKGERLSSLLERAGGFTDRAYLRGAIFTRNSVRDIQQRSLGKMIKRLENQLLVTGSAQVSTALSTEEVEARKVELEQRQKFIESLKKLKATGRMTIRLAHMRLLKGSEYDIELEDGDTLVIPTMNSVINIVGAVMSPGSFVYSDKMDYKEYIMQAGGYTDYADIDNVYVLKVDGSARKLSTGFVSWDAIKSRWEVSAFGEHIKDIEPGDTIVVPEKLVRIAWLREIKDITQILMQMAVTAGVIINLY